MSAYYNDTDPFAAQWLRNLVAAGHIAAGDVDERSIVDVRPDDLRGYRQCHFFAGIGGWSYALRLAGVGDDERIWTGSCPCQPFSAAGRQKGEADERHLWPEFRRLIAECRPATVFGEQVASKLGREWLAGVRSDLEALGFAVGAADLCAAGVGAPHIRQRLFWLGHSNRVGESALGGGQRWPQPELARDGEHGSLALAAGEGLEGRAVEPGELRAERQRAAVERGGEAGGVAHSDKGQCGRIAVGEGSQCDGSSSRRIEGDGVVEPGRADGRLALAAGEGLEGRAGPRLGSSAWSGSTLIPCADGKARRSQSSIFPLAYGVSGGVAVARPAEESAASVQAEEVRYVSRVGTLRGAGNAIVPQVAAEFVKAYLG